MGDKKPPREIDPDWVSVTLPVDDAEKTTHVEIMWSTNPPRGHEHTTLGELLYFRCEGVQFALSRDQLALLYRLFKASEAHSIKAALERIQREDV